MDELTPPVALRIGVDATEAGIANGERGGVYQYMRHLIRHVADASPQSALRLMFALPHYRHGATIRQFVDGLGRSNVRSWRCPIPTRYLRRWRIPVDVMGPKIDVFHSPSHLGLHCRSTPTVVTVHDLAYLHDRGGDSAPSGLSGDGRLWWQMRRNFFAEITEHMAVSVREATLIIAVSHAVRRDIVDTFGVPEQKIRVIHLAVREDLHHAPEPARGVLRDVYRISAPYWLYVGVLDPNKNLLTLIEGYARYRQRGGTRLLVIAGQSRFYGAVLKARVGELQLGDGVIFPGYVPDAHLATLYAGACGVVMPSPLEGFGLPAIEAMACRVPVVAANGGSLPEVVGAAGLLVEPGDPEQFAEAMLRVDEDRDLRERLIGAGTLRSAHFSWRRTALETLAAYAAASGKKGA